MFPIIVDIHEPDGIRIRLQKNLNVITAPNEPQGFADYYWNNGHNIIMIERKQAGELVSNMGGRLDHQLIKYKAKHPTAIIFILQEGLVTPSPKTFHCQIWKRLHSTNRKNPSITTRRTSPIPYAAYRSYLFSRAMEGVHTIVTSDEEDTALTISAMVYNSMKASHKGLNPIKNYSTNIEPGISEELANYMGTLLSIRGIGEKTAKRLLRDYETPWEVFVMDSELLEELEGERVAKAVEKGLGK